MRHPLETLARLRHVQAREVFWAGVIVLAFAWFFHVDDPLLAALAIPVEIVATVAIVRPHIHPPPGRDEDETETPRAETEPRNSTD